MHLKDFNVLTFDCYGTLIDWETGILKALAPLTDRLPDAPAADEVLQAHARYESAQQAQTPAMPYVDVLSVVYKRLAEAWRITVSWEACRRYGESVQDWQPFPDSVEALRYLQAHYQLAVLSNVDNASFAAAKAKLGVRFNAVYTAEDVGSYKPAAANFDYMLQNLQQQGINKADILHTAESLFHDHEPANRHGIRSCRIYRRHAKGGFGATMPPGAAPRWDFQFNSMADMARAHQAE